MIPSFTPINTTVAAVKRARLNSARLSPLILASPRISINLTPIRNTIAASTALGRWLKGSVRNKSTAKATIAVATCANWLRPPAESTIAVLVGLPFTTKVPLQAAATIGQGQAHEVHVFIKALAVTQGVGTGSGGTLRQDHSGTGNRYPKNKRNVSP